MAYFDLDRRGSHCGRTDRGQCKHNSTKFYGPSVHLPHLQSSGLLPAGRIPAGGDAGRYIQADAALPRVQGNRRSCRAIAQRLQPRGVLPSGLSLGINNTVNTQPFDA